VEHHSTPRVVGKHVRDADRLIRLSDAAYMMGRSKQSVMRLVYAKVLRCGWEKGRVWFRVKWITDYIEGLPRERQPKQETKP
jgi:hypothetical protein